jgi:hypothetical protein
MKDILTYDEMKEKLENVEIPDEIIDLVNEALEYGIATGAKFVGIEIGSKERQIKDKYLIALTRRLGEKNYKSDIGSGHFYITLDSADNSQEELIIEAIQTKKHKWF